MCVCVFASLCVTTGRLTGCQLALPHRLNQAYHYSLCIVQVTLSMFSLLSLAYLLLLHYIVATGKLFSVYSQSIQFQPEKCYLIIFINIDDLFMFTLFQVSRINQIIHPKIVWNKRSGRSAPTKYPSTVNSLGFYVDVT